MAGRPWPEGAAKAGRDAGYREAGAVCCGVKGGWADMEQASLRQCALCMCGLCLDPYHKHDPDVD